MSVSAAIDTADAFETLAPPKPSRSKQRRLLYALMFLQGLSAFFFLAELWSEVLGLRQTALPYEVHEMIQITASFGLLAGMVSTAVVLSSSFQRVATLSRQIDVVAGQFQTHLEALFEEWSLSRSERAVAVYAMKGFSNTEVAALRGTSVATVKTQLNAVYRKSGCANRQQLMSYLVEELLSGVKAE